ncbi:MAG: DUF6452 family protein [Bacteroidales bacterium]
MYGLSESTSRYPGMFFSFLMLTAIFLSACQEDEVCEEITANPLRIAFYLAGQDEETRAPIDSLTVYAVGRPDDRIYERENNVSLIEIPLDPGENSSGFVLSFKDTNDTIMLDYRHDLHLISVECGFTMFYNLTDVSYSTNQLISLAIANKHVTNTFDEHIQVFIPDPGNGNGNESEPGSQRK